MRKQMSLFYEVLWDDDTVEYVGTYDQAFEYILKHADLFELELYPYQAESCLHTWGELGYYSLVPA